MRMTGANLFIFDAKLHNTEERAAVGQSFLYENTVLSKEKYCYYKKNHSIIKKIMSKSK